MNSPMPLAFMHRSPASAKAKQSSRPPAHAVSKHTVSEKLRSSLPQQQPLHAHYQSWALENQDSVEVSKPHFCPVFLAGKTLIGYNHELKTWSRVFTNDCFLTTPYPEFVSPRITFDGHLMLLVWKSLRSDGLLVSKGLVADLRSGEYEGVEFVQEEFQSEDPGVHPCAIRLVGKGIYQIITLYVHFLETCIKIAVHGARFDRVEPCWESTAWYVRSDVYESSFLPRCSAYADGKLLCLSRASESWEAGTYILWELDLEMKTFSDMLICIEVPHEWRFNEEDKLWSTLLDHSGLTVEVEPLECAVLVCGSKLMLVFLFRVGPPPAEDRNTYYVTVRVHEIVDFYFPHTNYPPLVSMSPLMRMHTNDEGEYMSTTFISDHNFIYICPNYNSEQRDRVAALQAFRKEWTLLPAGGTIDLGEWKCWGETHLSYYPSTV